MSRSTYMQTLLSLPNYQKQPTVHWTKSIGQYTKPFQCWPQHSFNPYIKTSDFQQISKEKYSHGFKGASNPITYQYFTHAIVQMQFKRHIAFNTDKKFCTYIKGHMPDWHTHARTHARTQIWTFIQCQFTCGRTQGAFTSYNTQYKQILQYSNACNLLHMKIITQLTNNLRCGTVAEYVTDYREDMVNHKQLLP